MVKVLAEGAEAVVYETSLNGVSALMKRRIRKDYRIAEMDSRIRAQRSKNEARIIATVSKAGINGPRLLLYDGNDIYMSAIKGKKLSDALKAGIIGGTVFKKIGETLGRLHNAGIAHGDYTPANIILGKEGPNVIDFGLSEMTGSVEEKAFDILLMKRSVAKGHYARFLEGYTSSSVNANEVLKRLGLIERRGRYQTRTLT
jgi:Kae1-associated kinase Bud32